jgi:hypothetical protein
MSNPGGFYPCPRVLGDFTLRKSDESAKFRAFALAMGLPQQATEC